MSSLTTIYGVGAAVGTVAAFLSAYVGHTIYPIQTGGDLASAIETVKNTVKEVAEKVTTPAQQPLNTEVTPLEAPVEEEKLPQVELPAPEAEQPAST